MSAALSTEPPRIWARDIAVTGPDDRQVFLKEYGDLGVILQNGQKAAGVCEIDGAEFYVLVTLGVDGEHDTIHVEAGSKTAEALAEAIESLSVAREALLRIANA